MYQERRRWRRARGLERRAGCGMFMHTRRSSGRSLRMAKNQPTMPPQSCAEQRDVARARRVDQAGDVVHQVLDRVGLDAVGLLALAVAAQVRRPDAVAEPRQQRHLMAPRVPALGEAVQAERQPVAGARLGDVEAQAVGGDLEVAELVGARAAHGRTELSRSRLSDLRSATSRCAPFGSQRQLLEAVRLEPERHRHQVEVVADRVEPGQLDDLALVEVRAQPLEGGVADLALSRHLLGVGERRALALREVRALREVLQVAEALATELRLHRLREVQVRAEACSR